MARVFIIFTIILFSFIGAAALRKNKGQKPTQQFTAEPIEIVLDNTPEPLPPNEKISTQTLAAQEALPLSAEGLPAADKIEQLFNTGEPKLPLVKTLSYKSHVPWLDGRLAWISDYASHFATSRHFIARSLNGKPDYNKQDIIDGQNFNILDPDKDIRFHLIVDASRSKLWFYGIDKTEEQLYLLKTYDVGLGRLSPSKASGMLTPFGVYQLGSRTAIYKPRVMGYYNGEKVEMIQIFGTRWIPFEKEVADVTAPARGFGIHGVPWVLDPVADKHVELRNSICTYDSDGCIRLLTEDMEEIFSIIITKPTTIEIVKDFKDASYFKNLQSPEISVK